MRPGLKIMLFVVMLPVFWLAYLGLGTVLSDGHLDSSSAAPVPQQTLPYEHFSLRKVFNFPNGNLCAYGIYIVEETARKNGVRPWYDALNCQTYAWPLFGRGPSYSWDNLEEHADQMLAAWRVFKERGCAKADRVREPLAKECIALTPEFNLYRDMVALAAADPKKMVKEAVERKDFRLLAKRGFKKGFRSYDDYIDIRHGVHCSDAQSAALVFDTRGMADHGGYEWWIFERLLQVFAAEYNQSMIAQEGYPYSCEEFCPMQTCAH